MASPHPWEDFAQSMLDALFFSMLELDKASRNLGEEEVKEMIVEALSHAQEALGEVLAYIPTEDRSQREYAQQFLRISAEGNDGQRYGPRWSSIQGVYDTGDPERTPADGGGISGIEAAMAPQELHRVGHDFSAPNTIYTEQDIVDGMGWARTVIDDIRNVLLNLDNDDLAELAQMTLIGTRVLLSTAKESYRALTCIFGLPPKVPPPREPDEPADDGAGPRSVRGSEVDEAIRKLLEDDAQEAEQEWGGLPWDPLAPRLVEGAQFVATRGKERPVTTAVVLAAALPFSGLAVCVGAPVLAGDAALQWGAKTPVGRAIGQGMANAVELGKFCWVAGRLATKQTFRLANRELDRVGGASGLACKAAEGACWTATHPVEATVAGVGIANEAGKAAYGQALWMVDLLATVRDEMSS